MQYESTAILRELNKVCVEHQNFKLVKLNKFLSFSNTALAFVSYNLEEKDV